MYNCPALKLGSLFTLALIFLSHCDSGFPVSLQFWSRGINRLLSVRGQSKDVLLLFGLASKKATLVHVSLRCGVYGVSDFTASVFTREFCSVGDVQGRNWRIRELRRVIFEAG